VESPFATDECARKKLHQPGIAVPGHLNALTLGGRGASNFTPSRKLAWFSSGPLADSCFGKTAHGKTIAQIAHARYND
jgi:hypothetical protein